MLGLVLMEGDLLGFKDGTFDIDGFFIGKMRVVLRQKVGHLGLSWDVLKKMG